MSNTFEACFMVRYDKWIMILCAHLSVQWLLFHLPDDFVPLVFKPFLLFFFHSISSVALSSIIAFTSFCFEYAQQSFCQNM